MTQSESSIRSSAFVLFGRLTRFGSGVGAENFADQLQTNIPIFLVHLNDEVADVRKVGVFFFSRHHYEPFQVTVVSRGVQPTGSTP